MKRIISRIPRGPYGKRNTNTKRRNESMNILSEVRRQYPPHKRWGLLSQLAMSHYIATGDRQSYARARRAKEKSENMSCEFAMAHADLLAVAGGAANGSR